MSFPVLPNFDRKTNNQFDCFPEELVKYIFEFIPPPEEHSFNDFGLPYNNKSTRDLAYINILNTALVCKKWAAEPALKKIRNAAAWQIAPQYPLDLLAILSRNHIHLADLPRVKLDPMQMFNRKWVDYIRLQDMENQPIKQFTRFVPGHSITHADGEITSVPPTRQPGIAFLLQSKKDPSKRVVMTFINQDGASTDIRNWSYTQCHGANFNPQIVDQIKRELYHNSNPQAAFELFSRLVGGQDPECRIYKPNNTSEIRSVLSLVLISAIAFIAIRYLVNTMGTRNEL